MAKTESKTTDTSEEKESLGKMVVETALLRKSLRSSKEGSEDGGDGSSERDRNGSSVRKRREGTKLKRVDPITGFALFAKKTQESSHGSSEVRYRCTGVQGVQI